MDRYTRFRTPRTPTRLRAMYKDAIYIPVQRRNVGTNMRAPPSIGAAPTWAVESSNMGQAAERAGNRESIWVHHAYLITDIGLREYRVKASEEEGAATTDYDVPKLAAMFLVYAVACKRFAVEEDVEPEGFIACAVYALCEPTHASRRHNVYKRIAFECFYQICTEFPEFLYDAIRDTWSYPREIFTKFIPTHLRQ